MFLIIIEDITNKENFENIEIEDLCDYLIERYKIMPKGARIYKDSISVDNDITPTCEADIDRLKCLPFDSTIYFIILPQGFETWVYAILLIVTLAATFLLRPKFPSNLDNKSLESPNNSLTGISNLNRLNGRIPDIFGSIGKAVPDLIGIPFTFFMNNIEYEMSHLCLGRGFYEFKTILNNGKILYEIRDGDTLIEEMTYPFLAVWDPGYCVWNDWELLHTSVKIGTLSYPFIFLAAMTMYKSKSGENIILQPPNFKTDSTMTIDNTGLFTQISGGIDFTTKMSINDNVNINAEYNALFEGTATVRQVYNSYFYVTKSSVLGIPDWPFIESHYPFRCKVYYDNGYPGTPYYVYLGIFDISEYAGYVLFNGIAITNELQGLTWIQNHTFRIEKLLTIEGICEVSNVSTNTINFLNPENLSNWDYIDFKTSITNVAINFYNQTGSSVGPFFVDKIISEVYVNFEATGGLFKKTTTTFTPTDIEIRLLIEPVDSEGVLNGDNVSDTTFTVHGSGENNVFVGVSTRIRLQDGPSRVRISIFRLTDHDNSFTETYLDEIKVKSIYYGIEEIPSLHCFDNVTTMVYIKKSDANSVVSSDNKLNCSVTRKIPLRISGSTFTAENGSGCENGLGLFASNSVDDILSAIMLDPKIGNRSLSEIDFDSIYDTVSEINTYFGTIETNLKKVTEFAYTFDKIITFEETVGPIAECVYSLLYRRGNLIKMKFEKLELNGTILFNHRNKIPNSEVRTLSFGNVENNDSIEFEYINPDTNLPEIVYIPNTLGNNPKKIESIGVRNKLQAYFHACRYYNKLLHQHVTTEFESTSEGNLLLLKDKILVTDSSRPNIQDGEVTGQIGLEIELSQNVLLGTNPIIFLQYYDGIVESMQCSIGTLPNRVLLASAPRLSLVTDINKFARTTYILVNEDDLSIREFMVEERNIQNNMTCLIKAINYSDRYYYNDKDYIDDKVDINGNILGIPT